MGSSSNVVTEPIYTTSPGVFSDNGNGLGYGALEHANGSVITPSSPAQPGETVQVYASGLGSVYPPLSVQGAAGPVNPFSKTAPQQITVYVGGTQATVTYAGLAPDLAGLYQVDFTVPFNAVAGDNDLDISARIIVNGFATDSYNSQALIPVGYGDGRVRPAA